MKDSAYIYFVSFEKYYVYPEVMTTAVIFLNLPRLLEEWEAMPEDSISEAERVSQLRGKKWDSWSDFSEKLIKTRM